MKTAKALLVTLLTALVACSNGGGSGNGGGGETPNIDLKPGYKPANAVSKEDLQYYSELLKKAQSFMPGDAALFQVVLSGANAQNVQTEDYNEALAKLDATGLQNIATIKQNCKIVEAQSQVSGDQEFKVGAVSVTDGQMAIQDMAQRCPTTMSVRANQKATIREISPNGKKGARIVSYIVANEAREQTIQDNGWKYALQATSFSMNMGTSGKVEAIFSEDSMNMKADMTGGGSVTMELLSDYVRGPITFQMKLDSAAQTGTMQALYDLQTVRGAIRIVMIGDQTSQSIFINGEKMAPGQLSGLTKFVSTKMPLLVK